MIPLGVAAYGLALYLSYAYLVSPTFSYLGYRFSPPQPLLELVAWLAATLVAVAMPRWLNRPSAVILWIIFVITVVPAIFMAPYVDLLNTGQALTLILVLALVYTLVALGTRRRKPFTAFRVQVSPGVFWLIIAVFSLVTYVLLAVTVGLSLHFVSILDVYSVRAGYVSRLSNDAVLSYLVQAQSTVVNPLIIANGIQTRRWILVAIGILGQALIFSDTGYKTVLFSVPALILFAVLYFRRPEPRASILLFGATFVIAVAAAIDGLQHSAIWTSLFSRRFLLTPGMLTSAYVSFFQSHPQTHLSYSILSRWVQYPYQLKPPNVIGEWLANAPTTAMNANLFADGFENFGWFGLVGAGAVLLIYIRALDRAAAGIPASATALILIMPAISLSNASILTSMFSHGLVIAFVLIAIAPRTIWSPRQPMSRRRSARPWEHRAFGRDGLSERQPPVSETPTSMERAAAA